MCELFKPLKLGIVYNYRERSQLLNLCEARKALFISEGKSVIGE